MTLGPASSRRLAGALVRAATSQEATALLSLIYYPQTGDPIDGWGEGGCHIFARAVARWWGAGATCWVLAERHDVTAERPRLAIWPSREARVPRGSLPARLRPRMVHVLARVGPYFLDDRGVHTEREVVRDWERGLGRDRGRGPALLEPYDEEKYLADNVPREAHYEAALVDVLRRQLGPAWRWGSPARREARAGKGRAA